MRRDSIPTPSPPRRLAFPPTNENESQGAQEDYRQETGDALSWREPKHTRRKDADIREERYPPLPLDRQAPTPSVTLGGKPEVVVHIFSSFADQLPVGFRPIADIPLVLKRALRS